MNYGEFQYITSKHFIELFWQNGTALFPENERQSLFEFVEEKFGLSGRGLEKFKREIRTLRQKGNMNTRDFKIVSSAELVEFQRCVDETSFVVTILPILEHMRVKQIILEEDEISQYISMRIAKFKHGERVSFVSDMRIMNVKLVNDNSIKVRYRTRSGVSRKESLPVDKFAALALKFLRD